MTRPRATILRAACLLAILALLPAAGCGPDRVEPETLAADSPQADALALWAASVRAAPAARRPQVVRDSFDPSVDDARRDSRAVQVAQLMSRVAADRPERLSLFRGVIQAAWPVAGDSDADVVLMFRWDDDGALHLLGPTE